jgi:hypothetical protein
MMNPINQAQQFFNRTFLGTVTQKSTKKTESSSYIKMKLKQIAKRRTRNKIARKSRRYNRIHAGKKHCKIYMKG